MKEALSFLLFLCLINSPILAQTVTIAEARALPEGTPVVVEAIINCPDYGFNHGQFYIQDETGGVNIFFSNVGGVQGAITDYDEGDTVRVNGLMGIFSDQIQITPNFIDIIGKSDNKVDPVKITVADLTLDSKYQGMRVQIDDVTLVDATEWPTTEIDAGSGVNVNVVVGPNNDSLVIRIDRGESFFDASPIPDEPFTLTGIMGNFFETVQIYPFHEEDIEAFTTTNTFETLKLNNTIKVYPNPVQSEITLEILPQAGLVSKASLFDVTGKTIVDFPQLNAKNQTLRLPLPSAVKTGSYYLTVWTENGLRSSKVMVIK